eukprot:Amastigsp_a5000_29.p2 type:complete len:321 gc:universal Amastigsp_a5000_29:972-10(-)
MPSSARPSAQQKSGSRPHAKRRICSREPRARSSSTMPAAWSRPRSPSTNRSLSPSTLGAGTERDRFIAEGLRHETDAAVAMDSFERASLAYQPMEHKIQALELLCDLQKDRTLSAEEKTAIAAAIRVFRTQTDQSPEAKALLASLTAAQKLLKGATRDLESALSNAKRRDCDRALACVPSFLLPARHQVRGELRVRCDCCAVRVHLCVHLREIKDDRDRELFERGDFNLIGRSHGAAVRGWRQIASAPRAPPAQQPAIALATAAATAAAAGASAASVGAAADAAAAAQKVVALEAILVATTFTASLDRAMVVMRPRRRLR